MARLPYLEADQVAPEYRDMLSRNTNLHKLLVNSPDMARAFSGLGGYIRHKSTLDPRLRELAILQVGWMEKSEYEFTHHVKIGKEFGVTDDDIKAMMTTRSTMCSSESSCLISANVASDIASSRTISRAPRRIAFASGSSFEGFPSVSAMTALMSSSVTPNSLPIFT